MPLVNVLINSTTAGGGGTRGFTRGNAPPAPNLDIQYLVVGGGDAVYLTGYGGGGGGFLSGSASMSFNDTLTIEVGAGGTAVQDDYGKESYISSSLFGMLIASGAIEGQSGLPQGKSAGVGGPYPIGTGGGGGAAQNGIDGSTNASGIGGNGLQWLDGNFYAGGGGGSTNGAGVTNGYGGDGGGGTGAGTPYPTSSIAVNGTGGGAGGQNGDGGSGIVIIRYSTGSVNPPYDNAISGGTRTVNGGYVYHTFTGSAQFSYRF
jgi:hypothetical protein